MFIIMLDVAFAVAFVFTSIIVNFKIAYEALNLLRED